jgi:hypothetical protein
MVTKTTEIGYRRQICPQLNRQLNEISLKQEIGKGLDFEVRIQGDNYISDEYSNGKFVAKFKV